MISLLRPGAPTILPLVLGALSACASPPRAPADPGGCGHDRDCDRDLECDGGACVPSVSCDREGCADPQADAVVAPAALPAEPRSSERDRVAPCNRFIVAADRSQAVFGEIARAIGDPEALPALLDEVTSASHAVAQVPLDDEALMRFRARWVRGLERLRDQIRVLATAGDDVGALDRAAAALRTDGDAMAVLIEEVNAYCAGAEPAPSSADVAPPRFSVRFDTTEGPVVVSCTRAWAPHGVDHFHQLVEEGFYTDVAIFRAVEDFVTQFGIHGDPDVAARHRAIRIPPDPVVESNLRGMLTYAQAGRPAGPGLTADSRSSQLFFNLRDNVRLDGMGFAPICVVVDGMAAIDRFFTGYGEEAGRDQQNIQTKGNPYLRATYPDLDYIQRATVVPWVEPGPTPE